MQRLEGTLEICEYGRSEQHIRLQYLHDEVLQIPGFRHAGEDRMVGGLASLFDEPDLSLELFFGVKLQNRLQELSSLCQHITSAMSSSWMR